MVKATEAASPSTPSVRLAELMMPILEFSKVNRLLAPFYDFYSFRLMPWLGGLISKDSDSYRYLAESIRVHPDQPTLAKMMEETGLENVHWHNLTFGVCALHIGRKKEN